MWIGVKAKTGKSPDPPETQPPPYACAVYTVFVLGVGQDRGPASRIVPIDLLYLVVDLAVLRR